MQLIRRFASAACVRQHRGRAGAESGFRMITLQRWILAAIILFIGAVTPSVVAQNANVSLPAASAPAPQAVAPSPGCRDEQGLTYLCDLSVPEDILNVGSSGLLLVSGHRAPGHLYLIDPATRTQSELIHGATFRLQHDTRAYPDCPGPLNLQAFDVHGLSLAETSPRYFSLYTTSHGAREAIEIYDLDLRGTAPILTWKGCVLLQQDGYHNSVARLADGGFVATRMRDAELQAGGRRPRRDHRPRGRVASGRPTAAAAPAPNCRCRTASMSRRTSATCSSPPSVRRRWSVSTAGRRRWPSARCHCLFAGQRPLGHQWQASDRWPQLRRAAVCSGAAAPRAGR